MKTIVIYHRADFDGIFCLEIAKKFLGGTAEYIGWDFADPPLPFPEKETKYIVMDLPMDRPFGLVFENGWLCREDKTLSLDERQLQPIDRIEFDGQWTWIDHHKSSIDSHPSVIPGYRIDGVAACRLAWVWFSEWRRRRDLGQEMPTKEQFVKREVVEPLAVRLAGEYDIWDKRDSHAETFQFGLRAQEISENLWELLLVTAEEVDGRKDVGTVAVEALLEDGALLQRYQQQRDASMVKRGFCVGFEGLFFLALNTAMCNSLTFEAAATPEHDGLMGFYFDGEQWRVSLYHSPHHKEHDLSRIAVKFGGGGHRGACGFRVPTLPFLQC